MRIYVRNRRELHPHGVVCLRAMSSSEVNLAMYADRRVGVCVSAKRQPKLDEPRRHCEEASAGLGSRTAMFSFSVESWLDCLGLSQRLKIISAASLFSIS